MTDMFDRAQAVEEMQRDIALKQRFQAVHQASNVLCEDCDEPIPEQRRKMVHGCTRCVSCQQDYELKMKGFRR